MGSEHPRTLVGALAEAWTRWPERTALVCRRHRLTYGGFAAAAGELAGRHRQLGVEPGDRIVCCVANRCEYLIALAAAWLCGAVHVGVDHRSTAQEIATVVGLTDAVALVYEPSPAAAPLAPVDAIKRSDPQLRIVVVTDHLVPGDYVRWSLLGPPTNATGPEPPGGLQEGDPAIVFISSGTTGTPKATVGFHGNLAGRWPRLAAWLGFAPDDVHLAQLPLSHGFGLMMAMAALLSGGRLVLLDHFSAEDALRAVDEEGVTILNGAPTHFRLLLDRIDPTRNRLDTLRLSVGTAAPFPPKLVNAIWDRLGVDFMFMYGSSEGVGVATTDAADILRGSVGRPAAGAVAIVGTDRQPLPPGQVGEVAFSRTFFPVHYWGEADALDPRGSSSTDGGHDWYYSGDLGRLDGDGRLYIHGRIKHQIDRGGLKVDPVEVELALLRCPSVVDAAVIATPDPVLGQAVCACVVPAQGWHPTLDELRADLGRLLAPFKLPEVLYLLDTVPRTPIGKVDLPLLYQTVSALPSQQLVRP